MSGLNKLSSLNLSRTCINDQDMKFLIRLTQLSYLDIGGTKITDAGPSMFSIFFSSFLLGAANLSGITSLVHLSVSRTRVSDQFMTSVPCLKNLESLNLGHTQVSNQGLSHLRSIKATLRYLSLSGLPVTDHGTHTFLFRILIAFWR